MRCYHRDANERRKRRRFFAKNGNIYAFLIFMCAYANKNVSSSRVFVSFFLFCSKKVERVESRSIYESMSIFAKFYWVCWAVRVECMTFLLRFPRCLYYTGTFSCVQRV